jgi:hypothetical protein
MTWVSDKLMDRQRLVTSDERSLGGLIAVIF